LWYVGGVNSSSEGVGPSVLLIVRDLLGTRGSSPGPLSSLPFQGRGGGKKIVSALARWE
jgi:hypothetical protein